MSDRSYANIVIYYCPEDAWRKALSILRGNSIDADLDTPYPTEWPIEFVDEELRLSTMADACRELQLEIQEIIFWANQDAYYEYPGDRCIKVDGLPYSHVEPDNMGHVPVSPEFLDDLAQQHETKEDLVAALHEYLGTLALRRACEYRDGTRTPPFVINEVPTLT
jgi:hypothetical protein